jgi:hypothetical protein
MSGNNKTRVTAIANLKNSHRGAEEIRVTMGHAMQAMRTPMIVSLA